MDNKTLQLAESIIRQRREVRRRTAVVVTLSLLVAAIVSVWLMHTGQAQTHTEKVLTCSYQVHQHTADCYDADGNLICGLADYVIHTHNDDCYDADGNLVCPLPEVQAHTHDDSCYVEETYLTCGLEESAGHTHTADCYEEVPILICDNEDPEHVHTDECYEYEMVLICGRNEYEGHTHTADCYTTTRTPVCDKPEIQPHIHTDDCYEMQYETVTDADGNTYQAEVGTALICGQLQTEEHTHGEDCFVTVEMTADEVETLVAEEAAAVEPQTETADDTASEEPEPAENAASAEPDDPAQDTQIFFLNDSDEDSDDEQGASEEITADTAAGSEIAADAETASEEPTEDSVVYHEQTLVYEGEDYTVTVYCPAEAGIPDGAELSVTELSQDSEEYQDYLAQAADAVSDMGVMQQMRLFDIEIVCGDTVVEPAAAVQTNITYHDFLLTDGTAGGAVQIDDQGVQSLDATTTENENGGTEYSFMQGSEMQ